MTASLTSLDLAAVSGHAGIPTGLSGTLVGQLAATGSPGAPRAQATLDLTGGALRGWKQVGAHLDATAGEAGIAAAGKLTLAGEDALRFRGSLGVAPERLGVRKALLAAPLRVEAEVPRIALGRAAGETVPVAGTVEGRISIAGIAREPEATAELLGAGVSIDGRPLGDVRVSGKYARRRAEVEVALRPQTGGGTLRGTLAVAADSALARRVRRSGTHPQRRAPSPRRSTSASSPRSPRGSSAPQADSSPWTSGRRDRSRG